LGIPISYNTKDFTGKPLEELKYVVSVNLDRRHLDEFQKAEGALKYDKLYRKIARDKYEATRFTSHSGRKAIRKRWDEDEEQEEDEEDEEGDIPLPSEDQRCEIHSGGIGKNIGRPKQRAHHDCGPDAGTGTGTGTVVGPFQNP
jgi:hypothetical protein